jgi:gliding motility-associated-like protein
MNSYFDRKMYSKYKIRLWILLSILIFNIPKSICLDNFHDHLNIKDEITLTVLTWMCDHLTGPIALKVFVEGGTPEYTLYAQGLIVGKLSVNEFVILGLHGSEGVMVTVTDAIGNTSDFWAEPFIMPSPGADAGPDKIITCFDSLAVLEGFSPTDNVRYEWTGPDPEFEQDEQQPFVDMPGLYKLTVVGKNGCMSHDSTWVELPAMPEFGFLARPPQCFGESTGSVSFLNVQDGNPPYYFSVDGGTTFSLQNEFNELSAGIYNLIVQDELGCRVDTFVELMEPDSLTLELGDDLFIHYGEQIRIVPETNIMLDEISEIGWIPHSGLSCYDCLRPMASPENSSTYQLLITDVFGCTISDTLHIEVEKDLDVFIPNVFSPNGDGVNDRFYIKGANGVVNVKSLEIFDRWGNKVFSALNIPPNDPYLGWDGKFSGHFILPGVYVYKAVIEFYNTKEILLLGDLTLIR